MPKKAPVLTCTEEDRAALDRWTIEARLVERANIIMKCIQGQSVLQIAKDLKIRPNTVIDRRRRFQRGGIAGLHDLPRSGKPPIYGKEFRNKVSETLEQAPPAGQAVWDGPAVAEQTGASVHAVWRVLRKEGICLGEQTSGTSPPAPRRTVREPPDSYRSHYSAGRT